MRNILFLVVFGALVVSVGGTSTLAQSKPPKPTEFKTRKGNTVWDYLPKAVGPAQKVGCVLIPPAGSRLFHGMQLGSGDRAEHRPYADAGFAVVAFEISGATSGVFNTKKTRSAMKAFQAAEWGIVDAFDALALAQDKFPQIDRERIYPVGHSSAGTLALQIASSTNVVRACVAYAPVCDVEGFIGDAELAMLDSWVPGTALSLKAGSPMNRVGSIHAPVFLFNARDDSVVDPGTVAAFRQELARRQVRFEHVIAKSGGHYESMLNLGIPEAIKWLKKIDGEAVK